MTRHIKAVHENIRDNVCGECGYAASQKWDLKKHIEAMHENIKNTVETVDMLPKKRGFEKTH